MGVSSRYQSNNKNNPFRAVAPLKQELESRGKYNQALKNLSVAYKKYTPSSLGEGVHQSLADESLLPLTKLAELAKIKSQKVATKPHAFLTLPPITGRRYKKKGQRGVR